MKAKKTVRLSLEMDIQVSEEYLKALENNLLVEVLKHCFKNHTRTVISEKMEVIA